MILQSFDASFSVSTAKYQNEYYGKVFYDGKQVATNCKFNFKSETEFCDLKTCASNAQGWECPNGCLMDVNCPLPPPIK